MACEITAVGTSGPPTGAAGGDLTGTYPNPTLKPHNTTLVDLTGGTTHLSVDIINRQLDNTAGSNTVDWQNELLIDSGGSGGVVMNWASQTLRIQNSPRVDWLNNQLHNNSGFITGDWGTQTLSNLGITVFDWAYLRLYDGFGVESMDWSTRTGVDSAGINSIYWGGRATYDVSGAQSMDYANRFLQSAGGINTVQWDVGILASSSAVTTFDFNNCIAYDTSGAISAHFQNRALYSGGAAIVDYGASVLNDALGNASIEWGSPGAPQTGNGQRFGVGAAPTAAILQLSAGNSSFAGWLSPIQSLVTSPTDGSYWYDSTQKTPLMSINGVTQAPQMVFFTATGDGTVGNTGSELTLLGGGVGNKTLPSNFLAAGKSIRITVYGKIASTGVPTLRIKFKLGSTIICDTTATALVLITGTNLFKAEAIFTCRSTGSSGGVYGQAFFTYYSGATGLNSIDAPNTAATTVNTTVSQTIDVTATWGTSSSSNTMTGTNTLIEILN